MKRFSVAAQCKLAAIWSRRTSTRAISESRENCLAPQGADVQLKMSMLPKVAGQSCCGAGRGAGGPPRSDMRHASVAGQSAALRASFQTAAPYVLVAIA